MDLSLPSLLIGVGVVVLLFALYFIGSYNGLVAAKNKFKNAFAQIDVQLKERYDLIPNLVEIVKGYMKHERETLEAVIQARNAAYGAGQKAAAAPGDPAAMQSLAGAEGQLTSAMGRLMAIAESYPDLKANQNMIALQEELSSTENKVAFSRQAYNDAVMHYNTLPGILPDDHHRRDHRIRPRRIVRGQFAHRTRCPQGLLLLTPDPSTQSLRGSMNGLLRASGAHVETPAG